MEELFENSYDFEQVDKNPLSIKYDFVSSGEKEVPKRVILTNYNLSGLERYYNLGFGNITITDEGEEKISDMSRNNNRNDKDKVLKTVFTCALDYLSQNNDAILTFYGNTSAKHRLYKMGLNTNLSLISNFFNIKGGVLDGIKIVETREEGKKPIGLIDPSTIVYEEYKASECHKYNFITFELKEELKEKKSK